MPREKPYYRETIERLDKAFPNREIIKQVDLAKFLGCSPRHLQRHFADIYNKKLGGYAKAKIASVLLE